MQALLDNLELLAHCPQSDIGALVRICGVDAADIADMMAEIHSLDPRPGLAFDPPLAQPVVPDILMRAQPGGGWAVELNADTLPRVLVNNRYYARISEGRASKAEKDYLAGRLHAANWLVKALHQRATTILKVAAEIVRQQDAFFRHGVQSLRPLILRDIADAIGMHESTISRVTSNKYIATPRGVYRLKYFFTSAIPASGGNGVHSAEAVRHRIRGLIDANRRRYALGRAHRRTAAPRGRRYRPPHGREIPRGHAHPLFGSAAPGQAATGLEGLDDRPPRRWTQKQYMPIATERFFEETPMGDVP